MKPISRREFGALVAAGVVGGPGALRGAAAQEVGASITATEVIERIREEIGADWKPETIDTVKAGDPSAAVTGVVTTAMATLSVLQRSVAAGANLVVTCEPTFYRRDDTPIPPALGAGRGAATPPARPDPIYEAKNRFIQIHGLVVFRFCEHWRLRQPDPFTLGLAETLGWGAGAVSGAPAHWDIPPISVSAFARDVKRRLGASGGVRVVGDPQAVVRRAALLPGSTPIAASLATLPEVDAVVAGEVREWESVEYARDMIASGRRKALVLVGRVLSEGPGMRHCASWLESIVPEVAIRHIPVGDPYWNPA